MDFYLSVGFFLSFILFSWISLLFHKSYEENYNEVSHTVLTLFFGASANAAWNMGIFLEMYLGNMERERKGWRKEGEKEGKVQNTLL